jgi:hypothetical protein
VKTRIKAPAIVENEMDCSRESFLKAKEEDRKRRDEFERCWKMRTKPGYARIMSLAGRYKEIDNDV